ncbi:MAG: hypothetical protein KAT70_02515 [Thermoplasmata archaeon]|nr:hypothetical protein [Thermoplasmata archaeon]
MDRNEFTTHLRENSEVFEISDGQLEEEKGIYVKNKRFETETFFSDRAIVRGDIHDLVLATHQGRNIENITRVTGFFSKTQGWNKGKTGELKQRVRTEI